MQDSAADTAAEDTPVASKPWLDAILDSQKAFQVYQDKCKSIEKQYADLKSMADTTGDREFKMFWANLEVMRPSVYQRSPMPVVMPRQTDTGEVVRKAAELMERVLEYDVEADDVHETMLLVRDDMAICARGVAWVLDTGEVMHVDREDFVHEIARKWSEVTWVARRAYLTRDEGVERFGEDFMKAKLSKVDNGREDEYKLSDKRAMVWEIWSKQEGVLWVTEGVDTVLEQTEPLFNVKGFFPCPKPAYATLERGTLLPVPDFVYYRDQADEINELTARISSLSDSLRMKGLYAGGTSEVGEAIEAAYKKTDNGAIAIPVSNYAALGGQSLKDAIVWLPVDEIAQVIERLVALRRQLMDDVYEITGLSDIMRGASDPNETLGAQSLKAQFGSIRVLEKQNEMIRVALGVLRIKGEIYAEMLPIQELLQMAGMQLPTAAEAQQQAQQQAMMAQQQGQPPQPPEQVVTAEMVDQLLKSERLRPFAMEIETDSTIAPDEQAEKQSRIEFLTAFGSFIQQAGPVVQSFPAAGPLMGDMLKFGVGGFRHSRDMSGSIEEFVDTLQAQLAQPQEPPPDPDMIKAQADMKVNEAKLQIEDRKVKIDEARLQLDAQKTQTELARPPEPPQDNSLDVARLRLDERKIDLEERKLIEDSRHKDDDRKAKGNEALAAAGMPPDYSFNDDRQQFAAMMEQMTTMQQMMTEMVSALGDGQQAVASAITAQAEAAAAPKRIVRDGSGRVIGAETVQ